MKTRWYLVKTTPDEIGGTKRYEARKRWYTPYKKQTDPEDNPLTIRGVGGGARMRNGRCT